MNILIVGGTRFIGPFVARALVGAGHQVTLFNRGQTRSELPENVNRIVGEKDCLPSFRSQFGKLAPDVVLHMCAYTEKDAHTALTTFKGITKRLVVISSADVYLARDRFFNVSPGDLEAVPLPENAPLRERLYPYRSKAQGPDDMKFNYDKTLVERVLTRDPALSSTILRLASIYGPGDFQHRLFEFVKRIDDGRRTILMDKDKAKWSWSWGYVENAAAAICLAITDERAANQIYNVGESRALTMEERVQSLGRVMNWGGKVVLLSQSELPEHLREEEAVNFSQDWVVDTSKIRRELGFQDIVSPEESLLRAVAWERAHPPEDINPKDFNYVAEDSSG